MLENAGPGACHAAIDAASAATSAAIEKCPNARCQRRLSTASITISSVATVVRISSGANRISSFCVGQRLTGTGNLLGGRRGYLHLERYVDLGLLQHARRSLPHCRQKTLRI